MENLQKYFYISIFPLFGGVTLAYTGDGVFGTMPRCCFIILVLEVAYFDKSVIVVNAVVTIIGNLSVGLLFPTGFLLMFDATVWTFLMVVYLIGALLGF